MGAENQRGSNPHQVQVSPFGSLYFDTHATLSFDDTFFDFLPSWLDLAKLPFYLIIFLPQLNLTQELHMPANSK